MSTPEAPTLSPLDQVTNVLHGAHLECQRGAAFVTSVCGMAFGWDEEDPHSTKPLCETCHAPEAACPLCN